jgi:hypothetical protein
VGVRIRTVPVDRLPAPVERALFALVADAASIASRDLDVDIKTRDANVAVRIVGTAAPSGQQVVDRIAALDGTLTTHDTAIEAVIPCAS